MDPFSYDPKFGKIVTVPFRSYNSAAAPVNTETFSAFEMRCDNFGDRFSQISDCYQYWRFRNLRVRMYTDRGELAAASSLGLAYTNKYVATTVTTVGELIDYPCVTLGPSKIPLELYIPSDVLRNKLLPWYLTRDNGDNNLHIAGIVYRYVLNSEVAASTWSSYIIIEGEVELCAPVDAAINPFSHACFPREEEKSETSVSGGLGEDSVGPSGSIAPPTLSRSGSSVVPRKRAVFLKPR